jgi:hypothetical protein
MNKSFLALGGLLLFLLTGCVAPMGNTTYGCNVRLEWQAPAYHYNESIWIVDAHAMRQCGHNHFLWEPIKMPHHDRKG